MRCDVASDKWLPEQHFWKFLDQHDLRIALVDVPATIEVPKAINGVHLAGWGTHETTIKGSWPPSLWKRLKNEFGPPIIPHETYRPQTWKSLMQVRDESVKVTDQIVSISESILAQERWDLFFVGLGATHRGGHLLWDLSQIDEADLSAETLHALSNALLDVYQECDRSVARLIERAPSDARVLMFAVHGMGPEAGWAERVPKILSTIQRQNELAPAKMGLLYKIRQNLPWQMARELSERLPQEVLNWMVTVWSANMFDWKTTRYFPLPMDDTGFLRINLKGREPQGIVDPGEEYDAICEELREAFLSFRDIETNEPIVENVYRTDELAPSDAPYRDRLPDLAITWGDISAMRSSGIRSEKYGRILWNTGGRLSSGRSGGHLRKGWFVAVGDGIAAGSRTGEHRTVDLVPTIFEWLGVEPDEGFQGKPIPALCGQGGTESVKDTVLPLSDFQGDA